MIKGPKTSLYIWPEADINKLIQSEKNNKFIEKENYTKFTHLKNYQLNI